MFFYAKTVEFCCRQPQLRCHSEIYQMQGFYYSQLIIIFNVFMTHQWRNLPLEQLPTRVVPGNFPSPSSTPWGTPIHPNISSIMEMLRGIWARAWRDSNSHQFTLRLPLPPSASPPNSSLSPSISSKCVSIPLQLRTHSQRPLSAALLQGICFFNEDSNNDYGYFKTVCTYGSRSRAVCSRWISDTWRTFLRRLAFLAVICSMDLLLALQPDPTLLSPRFQALEPSFQSQSWSKMRSRF